MSRPRSYLFAALVLSASLGASADAAAQPSPAAKAEAAEAVKQADAHFRKGNQLYAEKKWAEAETAFLAAWALNPTYDVAANLGHTQHRLGKHRDAAEHLEFALRHWPLIGKPEPRKLAEERLTELRTLVVTIDVELQVEHADVLIDGKPVGQSPIAHDLFVTPGRHEVEARHDLYGKEVIAVNALKGATEAVRFKMSATPPRPPAAVPPPPPERRSLVPGIILGGAAVVSIAVGSGLLGVGASKHSTAQELSRAIPASHHHCVPGAAGFDARCADLEGAATGADRLRGAGVGMLVTAGVLAAATAGYFVWPMVRARVVPVAGKSEGGLWVTGSF